MNSKKTVLIVANDFVTAEAFERSLSMAGCDVVRLNDATALAWLTHERADAVFLDDSLPDLSVAEISHRLRDQPGTRLTPLVMLMGRKEVGPGGKQSPAGADLYVPRSIAPTKVVALVGMLLADVPLMRRPNDPPPWTPEHQGGEPPPNAYETYRRERQLFDEVPLVGDRATVTGHHSAAKERVSPT